MIIPVSAMLRHPASNAAGASKIWLIRLEQWLQHAGEVSEGAASPGSRRAAPRHSRGFALARSPLAESSRGQDRNK